MENASASEILTKIKNSKNILINMDTRTDYDSLCSSVVLYKFIKSLNINVRTIHTNKIGQIFTKFFPVECIDTETDISSVNLAEFDLVIFVDAGIKKHISLSDKFEIPNNLTTINFDHHITNSMYGTMNYVHHLGSCCSVLYKFFKELNIAIPIDDLNILAVGLLTDTGFFKLDSVTSEDFRIAAEMQEQGVKIWDLILKLTNYEYLDQIKYKELVFKNLKVNMDKKFAYSTITLKELVDAGIDLNKVFVRHSDLISHLEGADFVFVIAETVSDPKYYEISFRSTTLDCDVCKFAELFGGGGHKNAAGAKLYKVASIDEAVDSVVKKLNV